MNQQSVGEENFEQKLDRLRRKRKVMLESTYEVMIQNFPEVRKNTRLHHALVITVVEDYLKDYVALIGRYNIKGRIAKSKIAGLMAAAILKHRPIQLIDWDDDAAARVSKDNEEFAFMHGWAICAEDSSREQIESFRSLPNLYTWKEDLIYLFKRRPDSAECFNLIFETLCLTAFPNNFHGGE